MTRRPGTTRQHIKALEAADDAGVQVVGFNIPEWEAPSSGDELEVEGYRIEIPQGACIFAATLYAEVAAVGYTQLYVYVIPESQMDAEPPWSDEPIIALYTSTSTSDPEGTVSVTALEGTAQATEPTTLLLTGYGGEDEDFEPGTFRNVTVGLAYLDVSAP